MRLKMTIFSKKYDRVVKKAEGQGVGVAKPVESVELAVQGVGTLLWEAGG